MGDTPNPDPGRIPLRPRDPITGTQFLRIMVQSLRALGFNTAALGSELWSALPLPSPLCRQLLAHSVAGHWRECLDSVRAVADLEPRFQAQAGDLISRQKFLEVGSGAHGQADAASHVVAQRMALFLDLVQLLPLQIGKISQKIWVRGRRLERLAERASIHQLGRCRYRNAPGQPVPLFQDHDCGTRLMPCIQIMNDHRGMVLCVQFSHDGKYLVSSSTNGKVIIWTVNEDGTVSLKHTLEGHKRPVSSVKWSPDDSKLLTCAKREVRCWDGNIGRCEFSLQTAIRSISACAWSFDTVILGSPDDTFPGIFFRDPGGGREPRGLFFLALLARALDLAVTPDGHSLMYITSDHMIRTFRSEGSLGNLQVTIGGRQPCRYIKSDIVRRTSHSAARLYGCVNPVILPRSLSLSNGGQFLIVNPGDAVIPMMKVTYERDTQKVKLLAAKAFHNGGGASYLCYRQSNHIVQLCFGGGDCLFIASGSADSKVYIWHRDMQAPKMVLSGHTQAVNCVSWNPAKPYMLASASDDKRIRIWLAS